MNRVLKLCLDFITSLKVTVTCLSLCMLLIFFGTLDQTNLGIRLAQKKYFESWIVDWDISGMALRLAFWDDASIPFYTFPESFHIYLLPGGMLVGAVLLANLTAVSMFRFQWKKKKSGILLIHAGLILLLIGGVVTQFYQVESRMGIVEGKTAMFSHDYHRMELAVVMTSGSDSDQVVAIPDRVLSREGLVDPEVLPFELKVLTYYENASFLQGTGRDASNLATQGFGVNTTVKEIPPSTLDDIPNTPAGYVEVLDGGRSLGIWLVTPNLPELPTFTVNGQNYVMNLRPSRYYNPFSITLIDFTHERYPGTELPKNFSSQVRIRNPETGEDRETLIYMNNPLRYAGKTYYQASFGQGDTLSVLQVVENPGWLMPYISCTIMALGLAIQFLTHLVSFVRRKTK